VGIRQGPTDTWTLRQDGREVRVRPKVVFRSNALHALRELAVAGAGIALLPRWLVTAELSSRALQVVLPSWHPDPVTANAIHRKEQRGALRVRALIEHLRKAYAAEDAAGVSGHSPDLSPFADLSYGYQRVG
jgi:DNA-binding transcriptional LysR family regulator